MMIFNRLIKKLHLDGKQILMNVSDFPKDTPDYEKIVKDAPEILANGGSCIAGPDGEFISLEDQEINEIIDPPLRNNNN